MSLRPRWYIFPYQAQQGNRDLRGVFRGHHKDAWSHRDILYRREKKMNVN